MGHMDDIKHRGYVMRDLEWRQARTLPGGKRSQQSTNGLYTVIGYRDANQTKYSLMRDAATIDIFNTAKEARNFAQKHYEGEL